MRHIHTQYHPDIENLEDQVILKRDAARSIILDGEDILLLYTERYHDYTIPGGGLNEGEDIVTGMIRELEEETGAQNIQEIQPYGIYEEFRPWNKAPFNVMHQISYCYCCKIDRELGNTSLESHEVNNGMRPVWINIYQAIAHNEETIAKSPKKGMSIERETFLLHLIAEEMLAR